MGDLTPMCFWWKLGKSGVNLFRGMPESSVVNWQSPVFAADGDFGYLNQAVRGGGRPDFYVAPSGEAMFATGYRYSDSRFAEATLSSNSSPGTPGGHYFGPNSYDNSSDVQNAYQIAPLWSDVRVEGKFDTLQLYDPGTGAWNAQVPTTYGNTTNILEPYTSSYPEYGTGGVQQYITNPDTPLFYDAVRVLEE